MISRSDAPGTCNSVLRSICSAARYLPGPGPGVEVDVGGSRPDLVDRFGVEIQELALGELEQHQRPVGGHEGVAHRVVECPQRHVGRVGGVADVDRVIQQRRVAPRCPQLRTDPLHPVTTDSGAVRQRKAGGSPLRLQFPARSESVHVALAVLQQPTGCCRQGHPDLGLMAPGTHYDILPCQPRDEGRGRSPAPASVVRFETLRSQDFVSLQPLQCGATRRPGHGCPRSTRRRPAQSGPRCSRPDPARRWRSTHRPPTAWRP